MPDTLVAQGNDRPSIVVHPHIGSICLPYTILAARGLPVTAFSGQPQAVLKSIHVVESLSGKNLHQNIKLLDRNGFASLKLADNTLKNNGILFWQPDSVTVDSNRGVGKTFSVSMLGIQLSVPMGIFELAHRHSANLYIGYDLLRNNCSHGFDFILDPISNEGDSRQVCSAIYKAVEESIANHIGQWIMMLRWINRLSTRR
ncbi:MAG: hypothetical protein JJ934_03225 [Pseudomonadales bacterium]|nr:hypothetical protein [Pseudomonadales bacterium]